MRTSNQMITWGLILISELLLAVLVLYSKCGLGCLWSSVLLPCLGAILRVYQLYFCEFHSVKASWVTQCLLWLGEENQLFNLCHSPPGVWAHGDYCKINPKTGGIVMLGRRYSFLLGELGGNKCSNLQSSPRSKMDTILSPLLALY